MCVREQSDERVFQNEKETSGLGLRRHVGVKQINRFRYNVNSSDSNDRAAALVILIAADITRSAQSTERSRSRVVDFHDM